MTARAQIVKESAASLRLEGLRADVEVDELLNAWARDEVCCEDLREAERRILAGEPLGDLLAPASAGAPRAA